MLGEPGTTWQPWFAAAALRLTQSLAACCCHASKQSSDPAATAASGQAGCTSSLSCPPPSSTSQAKPQQAEAYGGELAPPSIAACGLLPPADAGVVHKSTQHTCTQTRTRTHAHARTQAYTRMSQKHSCQAFVCGLGTAAISCCEHMLCSPLHAMHCAAQPSGHGADTAQPSPVDRQALESVVHEHAKQANSFLACACMYA